MKDANDYLGKRPDIMLVDDAPHVLDFLSDALKKSCYRVRTASSGRLAIQSALLEPPDLILLDIMMPDMDGYEVCRQLKSNSATCDVPIIFVTARDQDLDEEEGLLLGAVDFIAKPIRLPILLARVETHLRQKYQQDLLEKMVSDRTAELERANRILNEEIEVRIKAEDEIKRINESLEDCIESRTNDLKYVNRELEAYNDMVSHDLKAPIRHIKGFCEMIRESCWDSLPDQVQEYFDRIVTSIQKMDDLIEGLYRLSQINKSSLSLSECDLTVLAAESVQELLGEPENAGVDVTVGELPTIECDRVLMRQVFANLVGNAMKYSRPGSEPRIVVSSHKENNEWVIEVQDNGVGFNMQHYDRLFMPFQRLHSDSRFEGSGLGLALVYRIIKHHGGRIWADSLPGEKTVFSLALPDRRG